jgi:hypothetical protein
MITKDEIIAQALAQGKTQEQAYKTAFPLVTDESARSGASRYLDKNPIIRQRAIDIVQNTAGMTLKEVIEIVQAGTKAEYENKFGRQTDWTNRLESAKVLLRLHGELSDKTTSDIHIDNRSVHIELSPEYLHMLNNTLDRFDKMRASLDVIDGEIVREAGQESKTDV